jgi:putative phosphoribosyl transferase
LRRIKRILRRPAIVHQKEIAMTLVREQISTRDVLVGRWGLPGILSIPDACSAIVVFAHGSGSSRFSARNRQVARALNQVGMATLLFDLLHPQEEVAQGRARVFDIPFLAERLTEAVEWTDEELGTDIRPMGLFGASTGAAAALTSAAQLGNRIDAVVSRGGRPDLAAAALEAVRAPTLLIVGGRDEGVIELNQQALARLKTPAVLEIVPGATHLFPEPGALEQVIKLATDWFETYLTPSPT